MSLWGPLSCIPSAFWRGNVSEVMPVLSLHKHCSGFKRESCLGLWEAWPRCDGSASWMNETSPLLSGSLSTAVLWETSTSTSYTNCGLGWTKGTLNAGQICMWLVKWCSSDKETHCRCLQTFYALQLFHHSFMLISSSSFFWVVYTHSSEPSTRPVWVDLWIQHFSHSTFPALRCVHHFEACSRETHQWICEEDKWTLFQTTSLSGVSDRETGDERVTALAVLNFYLSQTNWMYCPCTISPACDWELHSNLQPARSMRV